MFDKSCHQISNMKTNVKTLDGLRGIAILLVLIFHFSLKESDGFTSDCFRYFTLHGAFGVDLFFVLSGFLISCSLIDSKTKKHFFLNFYIRRVLRVSPIYYVYLFLCFFIFPGMLDISPYVNKWWLSLVTYTSNFTDLFTRDFITPNISILWSLAVEEQFYLVWPIFVFLLGLRGFKRLCLVLILIAFLSRTLMLLTGWSYQQIYVTTFCRMDSLAFGAYFAAMTKEKNYNSEITTMFARKSLISLGCFYIILLGIKSLIGFPKLLFTSFGFLFVGLFMLLLFIIAFHAKSGDFGNRFFSNKLLVFFGKYSYAMYLFHPITKIIILKFINKELYNELINYPIFFQLIFYLVAISITLFFAIVSWHLIEKHFLAFKKYFYE